ncbi:MAG TPA: hypothetical protein VMU07_01090 [Candidatus Paceibacterota bacterium]|nr:hypothetical protein [Candidatus Paceibacterota bacterium]
MALPESVVQQLGREAPQTPGWSLGIISFGGGILFIAVFLWAGLAYGYKPYLDSQASAVQGQIASVEKSVSLDDQTSLIGFYSQLSNLRTLLRKHTLTSNVFPWIETHTEPNVFYSSFNLASDDSLNLTALAKTEADANQQIAIFESSPDVQTLTVTGVNFQPSGYWQFTAKLVLNPSVFNNPAAQ